MRQPVRTENIEACSASLRFLDMMSLNKALIAADSIRHAKAIF
jgi:hypothetical protein